MISTPSIGCEFSLIICPIKSLLAKFPKFSVKFELELLFESSLLLQLTKEKTSNNTKIDFDVTHFYSDYGAD